MHDTLYFHHDAVSVLQCLHQSFLLKLGYGKPEIYLGAKLHLTKLHNGVWVCVMSPMNYVNEAVKHCKVNLRENYSGRVRIFTRSSYPFPIGYDTEMDYSQELSQDTASYIQSIICILRWMVELVRIDILTKLSLLSPN